MFIPVQSSWATHLMFQSLQQCNCQQHVAAAAAKLAMTALQPNCSLNCLHTRHGLFCGCYPASQTQAYIPCMPNPYMLP